MGTVYLLHFSSPYKHAKHYLGYTTNLLQRVADHRAGRGARLIEVITAAGISFEVVRTWSGNRKFERQLKKRKKSTFLCPVCAEDRRANKVCTKVV